VQLVADPEQVAQGDEHDEQAEPVENVAEGHDDTQPLL